MDIVKVGLRNKGGIMYKWVSCDFYSYLALLIQTNTIRKPEKVMFLFNNPVQSQFILPNHESKDGSLNANASSSSKLNPLQDCGSSYLSHWRLISEETVCSLKDENVDNVLCTS